ncbi:MAG: glycosyltransferase family 4 protein [Candidatus Peregrinibacteria bacterium]|nr:glycosyltransferase family 4 protein [Candidatus Peregrinibacteria bacterium]
MTRFPLESAHGGAEVQTMSLVKGLGVHGHAVAFLGSCPVLLEEMRAARLPSAELYIGPPPVTKWGAVSFLWRRRRMQKALIHALDQFSDLSAIVMLSLSEKLLLTEEAFNRGIRVLWVEHDRVGPWLTRSPYLRELRRLSSMALTVPVSELSREIYIALGWDPELVIAIPNGVDTERLGNQRKADARSSSKLLRLGCVARLTRDKGVDVLIDAVATIPEVSLEIIGEGREEATLRKLIRTSGAEDRITLRPTVPSIASFYISLDALILPSREHDPFGLVAAEAMSLGVPVIVTTACGIAGSLADGEDAIIVEPDSQGALQQGIRRLLDPSVRAAIGTRGKATVESLFSLEKMVERYEDVLAL